MENVQNVPTQSKLFAKGDLLLIAIILITAFGFGFHIFSSNVGNGFKPFPTAVEIYLSNKLIKVLPLTQEGYYKMKYNNISFSVQIKSGKVRMQESNCPRKVCVHQGWIEHSGESIICVPNKVVIKIVGRERTLSVPKKDEVDAITF